MPPRPQGDLIREQGEQVAKLIQRFDHLQSDFDRLEVSILEIRRLHQETDKMSAISTKDLARIEKRLDELVIRRWDVWKLIFAAFLGAILSVIVGVVGKSLDRIVPPISKTEKP